MRTIRKIRYFYKKFTRKLRKVMENAETFIADVLYDRKDELSVKIAAGILFPLSCIFSAIVRCRQYLYKKNIFQSASVGCPVIIVGNLTLGGTGKTPVVEKLARTLRENGRQVAILSRGYKSKREARWKVLWRWLTHKNEPPPRVVSNGKSLLLGSELAGDEPFMLASNLSNVVVIVDKDRVKAGHYAVKRFNSDVLILDDGYQYLPMRGYMNLLLIDSTNPFGNGHLIPRGILRESIKNIRRASYILLTKVVNSSVDSIIQVIRRYHPTVKIIQCAHLPRNLTQLDRKDVRPITFLNEKKIMAFSGIASPDSFERFLYDNKANIVYTKRFVDHHRFSRDELNKIFDVACAKGVELVVTTEKDAVRIPNDFVPPIPTFFLKIEIEIVSGEDIFDELISQFQ